MTTHSSIIAWEIQWTEKSDGLQSMGRKRVWHDLNNGIITFSFFVSDV